MGGVGVVMVLVYAGFGRLSILGLCWILAVFFGMWSLGCGQLLFGRLCGFQRAGRAVCVVVGESYAGCVGG